MAKHLCALNLFTPSHTRARTLANQPLCTHRPPPVPASHRPWQIFARFRVFSVSVLDTLGGVLFSPPPLSLCVFFFLLRQVRPAFHLLFRRSRALIKLPRLLPRCSVAPPQLSRGISPAQGKGTPRSRRLLGTGPASPAQVARSPASPSNSARACR